MVASSTPRRTQAERTATTRAALLAAARELFTERGFADTGREDIAERAGVTRGALYHHFASKAEVYRAVVDELESELEAHLVAAALTSTEPFEQLRRAGRAYVDACTDPAVARILIADAPAVLGTEECRARNAMSCQNLMVVALRNLEAAGAEIPGDPDITAALLLGMLNEAAALVAESPDRSKARKRVAATVDALLLRLLPH